MSQSTLFDPTKAGVLNLAETTEFSAAGIVSRALHDQDGVRVTLFALAAAKRLPSTARPHERWCKSSAAPVNFTLAGKKTPLRAGDLLHMPPGLPHAVTATEAFSMLLVIIREKSHSPAASPEAG